MQDPHLFHMRTSGSQTIKFFDVALEEAGIEIRDRHEERDQNGLTRLSFVASAADHQRINDAATRSLDISFRSSMWSEPVTAPTPIDRDADGIPIVRLAR